jgi:hypothetical protein
MGFTNGPDIVEDGLVFYIDAANKQSYLGSGTTMSNIIQSNLGSLNGAEQFQNTNGGILDFDGVDDRILIQDGASGPYSSLGANTTCNIWVNFTNTSTSVLIGGASYSNGGYFFYASPSSAYSSYGGSYNNGSWTSFGSGVWINYCVTKNDSGNVIWYGNGQQLSTGTVNGGAGIGFWSIGGYSGGTFDFNGQIGPVQVYTRVLLASEVLQNYNALKSRFE